MEKERSLGLNSVEAVSRRLERMFCKARIGKIDPRKSNMDMEIAMDIVYTIYTFIRSKDMSKVRVNISVDKEIYLRFKHLSQESVSGFVEKRLKEYVKKIRYEQDKEAFDALANEIATQEMSRIEKECLHDGL